MNKLKLLTASCAAVLVLALGACGQGTQSTEGTNTGETVSVGEEASQVLARVGGEEITVSQFNSELSGVRVSPDQDPKIVREAVLRAMVFRTAMRQIAERDGLQKSPEVSILIDAARDRILADTYLRRETGTTPPPTDQEIADFISQHPMQFDERRIYRFTRLTFPTDQFSDLLAPMFDETKDFSALENYFNQKGVAFTKGELSFPSSDFPKPVQDQLLNFGIGDNVVAKGPQQTVVLKIEGWTDQPLPRDQAENIARNTLFQRSLESRAKTIRDALAAEIPVTFGGEFAGLKLVDETAAQEPPASGTNPAGTTPETSGEGAVSPPETMPAPEGEGSTQGGGQ